MAGVIELLAAQPFWFWGGLAVALLAIEAATGTGWLLWPSASAGAVALLALVLDPGWTGQAVFFAVLTLVTTFGARRYFPRGGAAAYGDINDTSTRLVGQAARTVDAFHKGEGRIALDGKEWAAHLEGGGSLAAGAEVEVIGVRGSILEVRRRG
ncbi:NfeD family protein [Phenylobacterium sp.]|uniref:NfeD family protein n=1 Tax=Phenylobacterium sp. TaxID=1871053 RepID=UPI0025D9A097|nr:NfeD family protein [Phenylobacterium sp.]MCA3720657.1 NfeD family protein [Phenylobacterium sp.]MCA6298595.1 NfeD family protein [Phenylobacterium sp.]